MLKIRKKISQFGVQLRILCETLGMTITTDRQQQFVRLTEWESARGRILFSYTFCSERIEKKKKKYLAYLCSFMNSSHLCVILEILIIKFYILQNITSFFQNTFGWLFYASWKLSSRNQPIHQNLSNSKHAMKLRTAYIKAIT